MSEFAKIETKLIEILEIMHKNKMSSISTRQALGGFSHKPEKEYAIIIQEVKNNAKN